MNIDVNFKKAIDYFFENGTTVSMVLFPIFQWSKDYINSPYKVLEETKEGTFSEKDILVELETVYNKHESDLKLKHPTQVIFEESTDPTEYENPLYLNKEKDGKRIAGILFIWKVTIKETGKSFYTFRSCVELQEVFKLT